MSHVDFYILPGSQPDDRHQFACRLVEKAWHKGHRIHIHAESQEEAQRLDQLLWQFREDSFIPHRLQSDDSLKDTPVSIDWQTESLEHHNDVLINLAKAIPEQCTRFSRISEIVIQSPEVLATTREHYREYRELGFPPNTRDLRNRH
ncbi:DNA polymerase III, chi subunit [Elysia marginata]|uniref:DNA polymerase III, chi subunit n=1 Tax=Elysia marginata TaxID=1093978 RepID=A0AAV4FT67_9GAST|nr:DNA polymerase III, chi subunit [Elysia marginata]